MMQVEKTTDVKQAAWGSREEVDRQTEQMYWEGLLPLPAPPPNPQYPLYDPMSIIVYMLSC